MKRVAALVVVVFSLGGCAVVDPGHRGLLFEAFGGLHREVMEPGWHWVGPLGRADCFDITYSTAEEKIHTTSAEGLPMDLAVAVIYRPVSTELYELESEVGLNFYEEVVGPEFRSAARGVFARNSYQDLLRRNEDLEDQIEKDLRRRIHGKHVEIASVTIEKIVYAPEIGTAVKEKLAAEQDAARQKTLLENEAARVKLELESKAEQARLSEQAALAQKEQEIALAKEQAELDRVREESEAQKRVIKAKADAETTSLVARAKADEAKAKNQALTPLAVQAQGYEALKSLAGSNTHVLIGDWSKVPSFLFTPVVAQKAPQVAEQGQ